MLQEWENGLVGNNRGTVSGLPKRAPLAQVLVRAFAQVQARHPEVPFRRAA